MATPHDTSLIRLGVQVWVKRNLGFARAQTSLDDVNVELTDQEIHRLCEKYNQTPLTIQKWGQEARDYGCSYDTSEKLYTLQNGTKLTIHRRIRDDWNRIDGTMPREADDTISRYSQGSRQGKNTCALDVVIFCAIQLDAGRIRIDQLPMNTLLGLDPVPFILRVLVGSPWGLLTQDLRDRLRDNLMEALVKQHPDLHELGKMQDVRQIATHCFPSIPQLSYTTIRATACCDGQLYVSPTSTAVRQHFFELPLSVKAGQLSIVAALQAHFIGTAMISTTDAPCSQGHRCTGKVTRPAVVLDRMPPVLMIGTHAVRENSHEDPLGFFKRQEFNVFSTVGRYSVAYVPLGFIMRQHGMAHYTVCWRAHAITHTPHKVVCYDGMKPAVRLVNTWEDVQPHGSPAVMFYKRVETQTCCCGKAVCAHGGPPYDKNRSLH